MSDYTKINNLKKYQYKSKTSKYTLAILSIIVSVACFNLQDWQAVNRSFAAGEDIASHSNISSMVLSASYTDIFILGFLALLIFGIVTFSIISNFYKKVYFED